MPSTRKTAKGSGSKNALLSVNNLSVEFDTADGIVRAVHELSFSLSAGETLGIVGESGCGKSQALLAALGLLPVNGRASGSVQYRGQELLGLDSRSLNAFRGREIGMVFQDPMSALTPHLRIETQIVETILAHEPIARVAARQRAQTLLGQVQIADSGRVLKSFPHELSGGMRQRVMLAIALACGPQLLIADEPTTALDVTVQAQLLGLLAELKERLKLSVILVSHDLNVVARLAKRVMVMYAGRIVEVAATRSLFAHPRHPYTRALLASSPALSGPIAERLRAIPGQPPQPGALPPGCAFAPRCPDAFDQCPRRIPALAGKTHTVACHLYPA